MMVRDSVAQLIIPLFTLDTAAVEGLPDETLEKADNFLSLLADLSLDIESLFAEDGSVYITQVSSALKSLSEIGIDITSILPGSQNLVIALHFANALTSDQLDAEMVDSHEDFVFYEILAMDGLYDSNGDLLRSFSYHNATNLTESLQYLDLRTIDTDLTDDELDQSTNLNAIILSAICRAGTALSDRQWVMSSNQDNVKRTSLLRYHALLEGLLLTAPVLSPIYNGLENIAETVHGAGSYEQFSEPFEMLSEINSRRTVLDAFLSTYHSLENYMIRAKIAEVERTHPHSTLFGMRQFRGIYSAVDKTENDNLRNLFKSCKNLTIGGSTLDDYVVTRVDLLKSSLGPQGLSTPELVHFFKILGINSPIDLNVESSRINLIANLVYKIRCSIVHNKETEYHLSNRELQNVTILTTLTTLCIPVMRRIAYGLPAVGYGNPILYSRKELLLY